MAIKKSSTPYAKALFEIAKDKKMTSEVKTDMMSILTSVQGSVELKDLISNPTVAKADKTRILTSIFGSKVKSETLGLLSLMIQKGRIGQLASVCESFIDMANKESNTVAVKITTATQISDDMQHQIAAKVLKDSKFEIEAIIDPTIIGGYVLEFDNKMVDQSISGKIAAFKNQLSK